MRKSCVLRIVKYMCLSSPILLLKSKLQQKANSNLPLKLT